MKKSKKLFIVYFVVAIVACAIALVLIPKTDEDKSKTTTQETVETPNDNNTPSDNDTPNINNPGEDSSNKDDENGENPPVDNDENTDKDNNEDNDQKDDETNNETFATDLIINLPTSITMFINTKIELLPGYIKTEPLEMLNQVSIEIKPRYNSDPFGIEYSNSSIIANKVGSYSLVFSVAKNSTDKITKNVLIYVYDDQSYSLISQTQFILQTETNYLFNDVFSLKENLPYTVQTDSKMDFSENKFIINSSGTSFVNLSVVNGFIKYIYRFEFTIKEKPQFYITTHANTITINMVDSDAAQIQYEVKDKNNVSALQEIDAISCDETIIKVERKTDILIKIRAYKVGETIITIFLKSDPSIKIDVKIIVI